MKPASLASFLLSSAALTWAGPWTLVGLLIGAAGLVTRGRVRRRGRVIEFYGGAVTWFLRHATLVRGASAMTLGHTVLGQSSADLDHCRAHEMVHVRQYERWGPLFVPAYAVCSLVAWLRGLDCYFDNPFEIEAYAIDADDDRHAG